MRSIVPPYAINVTLFAAQAFAADANGTGQDLGESGMDCYAHFNVGVPSASDTITFALQESETVGGVYTAITPTEGTIPVFAATGTATVKFRTTKRFVRATATVAGATISIPASASLFATRKYVP